MPNADGERVKVLDFGVAKMHSEGSDGALTSAQTTIGSPHYMSPEQMTHPERVDARTDVWSMGVILYELLSGALPFAGRSFPEVCARVLSARAVPLCSANLDLPGDVCRVVERCLERQPEHRYPSMSALTDALRAVLPSGA